MNRILAAALAACLATPALAQGTKEAAQPASPAAVAPSSPAAAVPEAKGGQPIKALRAGCRDEAKAEGLKGDARRAAVSACVVKARPELAGREQCRSDGRAKGLKGEGLHAFVKDCLRAKA